MEGVSLNTNPTAFYTNDRTNASSQSQGAQNPPPSTPEPENGPRVNEGPSTVTTISAQAQQLAEQDNANAGNQGDGNSGTQQATSGQGSTGGTDDSQPQSESGGASATASDTSSGRLIDDESPNSIVRG